MGLTLLGSGVAAEYWRQPGLLNLAHYDGMAVRLQEAQRAHPAMPVYYDPGMLRGDYGIAYSFLFYHPGLLPELSPSDLLSGRAALPPSLLYVTKMTLPSAQLLAREGDSLRLYLVDRTQASNDIGYTFKPGPDIGGEESITLDGKPVTVRWLGAAPEFVIAVEKPVPDALLTFRLSTPDAPRRVTATVNGLPLPESWPVERFAWRDGYDIAAWRTNLRAGENRIVLGSDLAPVVLPDGQRRVTLLLIEDPVVSQPGYSP